MDGYLDQDVEKEIYCEQKAKLLSKKKSLKEEISLNEQKQKHWLEPMERWVKEAQNMEKIALDRNLFHKKVAAKKIFSSNLLLSEKQVRACSPDSDYFLEDYEGNFGGNHWNALRASHILASSKPICSILVPRPRFELGTYSSSGKRSTN